MKKISSIIIALVILILPFGVRAEATSGGDDSGVMPAFEYISDAGVTLYITKSNGKAVFNSNISGDRNIVLMIEIYVKLQKKTGSTWTDIADNSTITYDDYGVCEGTYYLVDRGVYRTETTFTVYTEDDMETIVSYSSEVTY